MGQYYDVINLDKREKLKLTDDEIDISCSKLQEYIMASWYEFAIQNLLVGRWKGDNVILLGDYANKDFERCERYYPEFFPVTTYYLIQRIKQEYDLDSMENDIYDWPVIDYDSSSHGYRYVYNHLAKQFLDYDHIFEYACEHDSFAYYPLILLLAVGNGCGMGDYTYANQELVGSWAMSSRYIEMSKTPLNLKEYKEFNPGFTYIEEWWLK